MSRSVVLGVFCMFLMACSSDSSKEKEDTNQPVQDVAGDFSEQEVNGQDVVVPDVASDLAVDDTTPEPDTAVQPEDITPEMEEEEVIAEVVEPPACDWLADMDVLENKGVVFAGHFLSTEIAVARVDGDKPEAQEDLEMGEYTHDMALDSEHGVLAVVQDVARQVTLLKLVPPVQGQPLAPPTSVAMIDIDNGDTPRFARFYAPASRLYVLAGLPANAEDQGTMNMHVYDTSTPTAPVELGVFPLPASVSFDIDPLAGVMFYVGLVDKKLYLYDITSPEPVLRPGDPIDLQTLYPEENNTSFQARNLTLDPWRGRVLMARSQGAFSEVIAFDYTAAVPMNHGDCPERVDHDSLVKSTDFFDLSIAVEDRPNLLDAYVVLPDTATGNAYMVADAWNGTSSTAIAIGLDPNLDPAKGCEAYEGFGCWLQYFLNGNPGSYSRTDGAACLDATHGVLVATTVDQYSEEDPGALHFFKVDGNLGTSPWLQESNKTMTAGALPVATVCY
jgi:hypothetical protein